MVFVAFVALALALLLRLGGSRARRAELALVATASAGTLGEVALHGHRWQLVPVYSIIILGGLWLCLRRSKSLGAAVSIFLGLAIASATLWAFPIVRSLPPAGPYPVGTTVMHWTDETRAEWFTETEGDAREVVVQLWYPARQGGDDRPAPYFDYPDLRHQPLAQSFDLPSFVLGHLAGFQSHSYPDLPFRAGGERSPIVVFSHGLRGTRVQNTSLMESLASEGYVVAAVDHPFDSFLTIFPDGRTAEFRSGVPSGVTDEEWLRIRGRQLDARVADVAFVLGKLEALDGSAPGTLFAGRLDLDAVGVLGHSFGGATAVLAALSDSRWGAVAALDGWFVPLDLPDDVALQQPFLYLGQERWPRWNEERQRHSLDALLANSATAYRLSVLGSRHHDYTDVPLFSRLTRLLGLSGAIEPERMATLVNAYVLRFFNHHLRGNRSELLGEEPAFPEVLVEHRPP